MKLSQDLLLGIGIGAVAALVLTKAVAPAAPVQPTLPTRKTLPPASVYGQRNFYPRGAYVAELRPQYLMPAWYAA